jgi:hypothetical protein
MRATTAVVVDGIDGELSGAYSVTLADDASALRLTRNGSVILLRPRHARLRSSDGNEVDVWTICNAFVDGTLRCVARCSLTTVNRVYVVLDA